MRTVIVCSLGAALVFTGVSARMTAQQAAKAGERAARAAYAPPRTPWGDPQLAGIYSNDDETGVPFERPPEFAGRRIRGHHASGARRGQQAAHRAVQCGRRRHGVRRGPPSADPTCIFDLLRLPEQHAVARRRSARRRRAAADRRGAPARAAAAVRSRPGSQQQHQPGRPVQQLRGSGARRIAASRAAFRTR